MSTIDVVSGKQAAGVEIGDHLSPSRIDMLNLCPRKFYYRYERYLEPKHIGFEDQPVNYASPRQFGTALHAALASLYEGKGFDMVSCPCPSMEGCEFCKGNQIPRMAALFLLHYPHDPEDDPRDPRTRQNGVEILYAYLDKYRREQFEVLAVEVPFLIEVKEELTPEALCALCANGKMYHDVGAVPSWCNGFKQRTLFVYIGIIDLLTREHGIIVPWDHKSSSRYGLLFEMQWKLSGQITSYMYASADIMQEPVNRAGINSIRTTSKISSDSFLRIETSRTQEDFDEWEREVRFAWTRIQQYRDINFWPKAAPFACTAYNSPCSYYALCTAGGEKFREQLISSAYERVSDRPFGHIEE